MMIFKKAIPRRRFLQGIGASVALPLLDAMVPAHASMQNAPAKPVSRLGIVYVPNGMIMEQWTPATDGTAFALTPILEPLAPFRDHLLVISGLASNTARRQPGEGGGDHPRAGATFLTGVHPRSREGDRGISVDQIAARQLGARTQLASLEVSLDSTELAGVCDAGYSLAYTNTLSWRNGSVPMPMENHPRAVFERMFGDTDSTNRKAQFTWDKSILDAVTEDVSRLSAGLDTGDRAKLGEYLDAVRDVERRIQMTERQSLEDLPEIERPAGIPARFDKHAKLMFDLQVLALQTDMTRVITFMMSREQSNRAYPEIGIAEPHHPLSHHQDEAPKIAKVAEINVYHAKMFAYFLERLQATRDGNGSLLDHSVILYGSGISNGNLHWYDNLPVLLAGSAGGRIKGGRHVRHPQDTPLTNLHLTLLDLLGIPVENLGDSTGRLNLLPVA